MDNSKILLDFCKYAHNNLLSSKTIIQNSDVTALQFQTNFRLHSIEIIKMLTIGYIDSGWHYYNHLQKTKNYNEKELIDAGIAYISKTGKICPRFNNIYIYPHFLKGKIANITAKDLINKKCYKLIASAADSNCLFYNQDSLDNNDRIILVEGQNDVLSIIDKGKWTGGVIATSGQLSDAQMKYLSDNQTLKIIYIAFDKDDAGKKYIGKMLDLDSEAEIRVLNWDEQIKDIDEFLSKQKKPEKVFNKLIETAMELPVFFKDLDSDHDLLSYFICHSMIVVESVAKGKIKYIVNPYYVAQLIMRNFYYVYIPAKKEIWRYDNADELWVEITPEHINAITKSILKSRAKINIYNEVKCHILSDNKIIKNNEFSMNSKIEFLPLKNVVLNIETGKIIDYHKNLYISFKIPINFNPAAQCPKWVETLNIIFKDDQEIINIIQEFFGLCLTTYVLTLALFLVGDGASGKSTILKILEKLIGEKNISALSMRQINNPVEACELKNKLLNICSELNANDTKEIEIFKRLVDGETIQVNPKYKPGFSLKPYAKFAFSMNQLPRTDDKSFAFQRRVIAIPFSLRFVDKIESANDRLKDITLHTKLLEELPGILNWALKGLHRLKNNNWQFTRSDLVEDLKKEIVEFNDIVQVFFSECVIKNAESFLFKDTAYNRFNEWCVERGEKHILKAESFKLRFSNILKREYGIDGDSQRKDEGNDIKRGYMGVELR
ncbi:toprim domain-containing protein [Candidatus Dependentiae bacterium]|nr:toprim domain-containing protein [Candidatus Dependentiae bacterium]